MRYVDLYENENVRVAYHGSPHKFEKFSTSEIFLARDPAEAKRYGNYLYEITFDGNPMFETPTIMVIAPEQVTGFKLIGHDPSAKIYRT